MRLLSLLRGGAEYVQQHGAHAGQDVEFDLRASPGAGQFVEAQGVPELTQRPDVAGAAAVDEAQPVQGIHTRFAVDRFKALSATQRRDQCVDVAAGLQPAKRANRALARLPLVIAEGLDELRVAPGSGLGDLDEQGLAVYWRRANH